MSDLVLTPFPLKKTNYTSIDYLTLREELLSKLPIITNGQYTDMDSSDPGVAILELLISASDNLLFNLDMMGAELDLDKARQRESVIKLLRLIGYNLNGTSASKGTVTFYVSPTENPIYPVTVLKGTQVTAQGQSKSITFSTSQTTTLTGPSDSKTVSVIQGVFYLDNFTSDGSPNQKFVLSSTNIDRSTVEIFVDDNVTDAIPSQKWTLVSSFFDSDFNSQVFKVQTDAQSRVYITFGDGQFGKIPPQNAQITANYVKTDGSNGNVGRNAINKVSSGLPLISDKNGSKVSLSVLNSTATAGGADTETIEHGKQVALGLLYGLNRALSRADFKALMLSIPGVDKAVSWGENEEDFPDYKLMNRVRACFFSNSFSDMYFNEASRSSYRSLRDNQVKNLLSQKMPITTVLEFIDPIVKDIFVSLLIGIDLNKYDPNLVLDTIRYNITNTFSIDSVQFGQDVRISNILQLVTDIEGVSWAKITRLHTTPPGAVPDIAPNPPLDIVLDKFEIPSFIDTPTQPAQAIPSNISPPYIRATTPKSNFIGLNNVIIINPDEQSDILENGYSLFPGSDLKHIEISYTSQFDEPSLVGRFADAPTAQIDLSTISSNG